MIKVMGLRVDRSDVREAVKGTYGELDSKSTVHELIFIHFVLVYFLKPSHIFAILFAIACPRCIGNALAPKILLSLNDNDDPTAPASLRAKHPMNANPKSPKLLANCRALQC